MENIISKERLYELYIIKKMSDQKISDEIGIKRRDVSRLRKLYNIKHIEKFERFSSNEMSCEQKNIIIGSILGDGCLRRRGNKKRRIY